MKKLLLLCNLLIVSCFAKAQLRCAYSDHYTFVTSTTDPKEINKPCAVCYTDNHFSFYIPELGTRSFQIDQPIQKSVSKDGVVTEIIYNAEDATMMMGDILVQVEYGSPTKTFSISYTKSDNTYIIESNGFIGDPEQSSNPTVQSLTSHIKNTTHTAPTATTKVNNNPPIPSTTVDQRAMYVGAPAPTVDQRTMYKGAKGDSGINAGTGSGKGNGISNGQCDLKYNLSGRSMLPLVVTDNSQKQGVVAVAVTVDRNGNVIEADYSVLGSTTNVDYLVNLAIKTANKAKFSDANIAEQKGSIIFSFRATSNNSTPTNLNH